MKKQLLFVLVALALSVSGFSQTNKKQTKAAKTIAATTAKPDKKTLALRKSHAKFLASTPFTKTNNLSKKERKAAGIPPNKYYEQEWELTMNPATGRPNPENLDLVRNQLQQERAQAIASGRTPGDGTDNNWIERGPDNVGGRVRALMFDPNDPTYKTVFAGGVSGGLWKNTDITSAATVWTRVNIPENLAVSAIAYDPNNTNVFYVGTGESYVGGDVNGDGVWKSVNGGASWTKIFGGITGPTAFYSAADLTINSPAGIAGNYACYPTTNFGTPVTTAITANVVLVNDGTATPTLGCFTLANASAVNGKIALIRRGSCPFVQKVKAAQDAGAIGVIMMNNIDGTPIAMGGDDPTITIPSIMITKANGDAIEAAVIAGTVNATLNPVTPGAFTGNLVPGKQHINAIKIRNNGGTSEVWVAAGDSFYSAANSTTFLGGPGYGLFKSTDGGASFTEIVLPLTANGNRHCPNDIEIAADNKIWVSTTSSVVFGDGGGRIFSSADGNTFISRHTVTPAGDRTQIAVSGSNADKIYVLVEDVASGEAEIYLTTNGFATAPTKLAEPATDGDISATDFTRGQAFYDLMIEVDPTNDAIVYIGGINLHRSSNSGSSWTAISGWLTTTPSTVHADQHAMIFRPGSPNMAIFGNDGGVFYASTLSGASTSSTAIAARNKGLNITQFYSMGVAGTNAVSGLTGDYFAAGAQDNGTQYFGNAVAGIGPSVRSQSGDGAFTMFDQGADKYYISNYIYNQNINLRPLPGSTVNAKNISTEALDALNGAFIAPMALDSSLDMIYADYSTTAPVYQIRRYSNIKTLSPVVKTNLTNALLTSPASAFAVSKYTTASTTLLVGTRLGKLLRVTNANATPTWTDITGSSFVGSISDVDFGASNNNIFVTMHNYNVVSIWYSADAGVTWQNKEGNLPDIPVKCIMQNPLNANEVIIGTELGVWYTNTFNTASPVWNQSYNGMSNVKVTDLDVRNDNTVFAATYGRGIFSGLFTSTSLSTNDVAATMGIRVYPNPSNGILNLAIANYSGKLAVEVYDINGRNVHMQEFDNFSAQSSINMDNLQAGIYVVQLKGDNLNYSQKVLLN